MLSLSTGSNNRGGRFFYQLLGYCAIGALANSVTAVAQLEAKPQFVCNQKPPKLMPELAACTSFKCIVQDGSWNETSAPDGTSCRVSATSAGTCQSGWCNDCQVPTSAGTLLPSYVVVGLVYSPPGCTGCASNSSAVDYTNSDTVGTTISTENSFNQDYSLSVGTSGILGGGSVEITGDYSTTNTTSNSQTISQTQQYGIKATGNQDGINHDQDTFIILLNPSVSVYSGQSFHPSASGACTPTIEWRTGLDGASAQPYKLTVQDLRNFTALAPNVAATLTAHGITQADFDTIRALDPFADGNTSIDPGRYVQTTYTFPYEPANTSQQCNSSGVCTCMAMSSTKIQNELTSSATATKTSYSVGLKESATFGQKNLLSATVTATQKFSWTTTASQANTTSSTKSATVSVPCPSPNWKAPEDFTQINVYWDTWYGSFMFAPMMVVENAVGAKTFTSGNVVDSLGHPIAHEPIDVTAGGTTYHTFTNGQGEFAVYGIKATTEAKKRGAHKAFVRIRKSTFDVELGTLSSQRLSLK